MGSNSVQTCNYRLVPNYNSNFFRVTITPVLTCPATSTSSLRAMDAAGSPDAAAEPQATQDVAVTNMDASASPSPSP